MGRIVKQELQRLVERVARLDCAPREEPEAVREELLALLAEATRLGVRSPWLLWRLAATLDQCQCPELALPYIEQALELDPLVPPIQDSRAIIVRSLRRKLVETAEPEEVPALYQVLLRAGEADEACHLAMVRCQAASGKSGEALRIVEALTILAPACTEAWQELAKLARAAGRAEQAREAELQASMVAAECGSLQGMSLFATA